MKPELITFLKDCLSKDIFYLGKAKEYLKTLPIDDKLDEMLSRLLWKHGPYWSIQQYIPPKVEEVDMKKKKAAYFRVIGDVHGKYDKYAHLAAEAEYSFQVGDMGFEYSYLTRVVDSDHHKIIGGNHDNYTKHPSVKGYFYGDQSKHFLGDYGIWNPPEFEPIFYFRGAWSIDQKYRTEGISWWEEEEVPYKKMLEGFDFYKSIKPEFVITHTAPASIVPEIPFEKIFGEVIYKPRTEEILDQMYQEWQPKIWIFGHWHVDWEKIFVHPKTGKETKFICLAELSHKDFERRKND